MMTTRPSRRLREWALAGLMATGGLLGGIPVAQAATLTVAGPVSTGPVTLSVTAPVPPGFCSAAFCYLRVTGSWNVSALQLPTLSATTAPTAG
jgi:hypothetical protein